MEVRKTNGTFEEFDREKLMNGIRLAYVHTGQPVPEDVVVSVVDNLFIYDKMSSQEIRRQVVDSLMSINKKVALEYIETFDRGTDLRKKRDFIKDYIKASNAATGSKFDSNANITHKNIVTLGNELYKENNIKQNRYIMQDKIKSLYSRQLADQYIQDLESHVLYKHDESGTPGYPYCVAITMFCELCFERGIIVPTEEIHHKLPLSEGGTHDRSNLIALCKSCHSTIHAKRGDYWGNRRG